MSNLSDQDRKAYEAYLLATTDDDKQEAIKKLIPGSHLYYHLYFLDKIKKVGSKLSSEDLDLYAKFAKKYQGTMEHKEIETKLKFLEYDDATTQEEREKVLNDLVSVKFLNLSFEYAKPDDLQRHGLESSSSAAENTDQEEENKDDEAEPSDKSGVQIEDESDKNSVSDYDTDEKEMIQSNSYNRLRQRNANNNCDDDDDFAQGDEEVENLNSVPQMQYQEQAYDDFLPQQQQNYDLECDDMIANVIQQQQVRSLPMTQAAKDRKGFRYDDHFSKAKVQQYYKGKKGNDSYTNQNKLRMLPIGLEQTLDFTLYNPKDVYQWALTSGKSRLPDLFNDYFYSSLKKAIQKLFEEDKYFSLPQDFCNSLTLQQLDKISNFHQKVKEDKNYIGSYFQKLFHEELSKENQDVWSYEEKRDNLKTLYKYTINHKMPQSLISSLLIEILELGITIGEYDQELFMSFVTNPIIKQDQVFNKKKKREYNQDGHWNQYINNVQSQNNNAQNWNKSQKELIDKYLEYFCQQKGSLEEFKEEFSKKYLKEIEERVKIYNSDDMTNLNVDLKKYQEISQEVSIRFLEYNKEQFTVDEEVKLSVEIKNVQTMFVKIFEFNTETYYKKTLQPFNTGVNLDGLIASIEKSFEYKTPSNKKFIEQYSFSELNGKVGLFIVEFIGNGMSARAVIKKGQLSLIHKSTIAGHLAYILDENKKICVGPKTGVLFDGTYYPADQEKEGKIFIPFGKTQLQQKAILMNNGFAQLCDFERKTEAYSFSAWIHLNSESVLIGNKASIIIRPSLIINSREAELSILKNTKVTLTTQNYIDNIPVTKTFENIKFKNNKEEVLDFQVPPYLSNINVLVETEVYNVTKQAKDKFSAQKSFNIQTHNYSYDNCDAYLRKEKEDYVVYVLGKNGEPKSNVNTKISFMHVQLPEYSQSKQFDLKTSTEGKILLGPIKKIIGVNVVISSLSIEKAFLLPQNNLDLTYPSSVDAIENETLEFPVVLNSKKRTNISLIKKTDSYVLDDLYDKIEFIKQDDKYYNLVKISGLQDGKYTLSLKKQGKNIPITVHKGSYWEGESFILKKNCLFENNATNKMVKIAKVQSKQYKLNILVEENKEGTSDISIKIDDFSKYARVHIVANQFQKAACNEEFITMNKFSKKYSSRALFQFATWQNIYMSNKELSDEFRYVFDRKYAERYQGNTLERPRLLLKRTYLDKCQINQETLNAGTNYQNQQENVFMMQNVAPRSQMIQQSYQPIARGEQLYSMNNCQEQAYQFNDECDFMPAQRLASMSRGGGPDFNNIDQMLEMMLEGGDAPLKISEFQNFLQNSPFTLFNAVPNEHGIVKFSANLRSFTQLQVLVVDQSSVSHQSISLDVNPIQKRDLSLKQTLDVEKGFTESRTTLIVQKGDTHQIEDINSTEIQLIDDLTKVKGVLEELMKNNGTNTGVYKELISVFLQWPKINTEEKCKLLNKHFCHELNIFISMKDPEFFESHLRPFLSCKMEKTFIDNYLLGDFDEIVPMASLEQIEKINALEQCLLVNALVQSNRQEDAQRIVEYFKMRSDCEYRDEETKNRIFDTVLNLNIMKPENAQDGLLQDHSQTSSSITSAIYSGGVQLQRAFMAPSAPSQRMRNYDREYKKECEEAESESESDGDDDDEDSYGSMQDKRKEQERSYKPLKEQMMKKKKFAVKKAVMEVRGQQKRKAKMNFEEISQTNQYVETNYYKQTLLSSSRYLIPINPFWRDYAVHIASGAKTPFLSANFIRNAENTVAALLTFAFIDLPFNSVTHGYKTNEGRGVEISATSSIILFKKEVREAKLELSSDILVTHRYVSTNDGSSTSAAIPEEFLVNKAYQCEVIMTNVSPQPKNFSVLYQIPAGSLPLQMTKYMKSHPMTLSPYTTLKTIFYFYFPSEGLFVHFPSNVAEDNKVVSRAAKHQLKVVTRLSINKKETFKDIIASGNKDDIIEFLKTANLINGEKGFQFTQLFWMLKDQAFFKRVIAVLRGRIIYSDAIWSFSLYHKDDQVTIREYLMKGLHMAHYLGYNFTSKLVTIKQQDKDLQHIDFYPILNSRAHLVGETENWTLNQTLKTNYEKLLVNLATKREMDNFDKIKLVYYLQLQDRINEAIHIFSSIDINSLKGALRVQYDYMNAYFDFFTGEAESFKTARSIVRKYEDYPIPQWRILFLEILDQLNEYDGEAEEVIEIDGEIMTEEQKKQKYKQSVKKEPRLQVEVSSELQNIQINLANIKQLIIKFYIIDAEILFSRTPFLQKSTDEFSYVKPCHIIEQELQNTDLNSSVDTITFMQAGQKFDLPIPEHLKNQNMVIEINGDEKQIFKTYYSTQIQVTILDTYGELKVTDKLGQALSKIYVKVYAQKKGGSTSDPFFFKDGYTDIRGKFEYAQSSGNRLNQVQKFAIFVMSDTLGSIIKECDPPKQEVNTSSNSQEESVYNQRKEQRIISKVANWKASKSKK